MEQICDRCPTRMFTVRMDGRIFPCPVAMLLFGLFSANAYAATFSRTVISGQPTRIAAYHSWDPGSCNSLAATMNVVVKPSHGTLIPHVVPHIITSSRFVGNTRCAGKPIKALQVDYKSTPGYHGTDTFTIDVIFGFEGRRDTDVYSVTVQ